MTKIFTILITLLTLSSTFGFQDMQDELISRVNTDLSYSDGSIKNIECGSYFSGVFCFAELEFVDFDDVNPSALTCNETYTILSKDKHLVVCSDCWFSTKEPYYKKSCK
jgi:hypothetical protein